MKRPLLALLAVLLISPAAAQLNTADDLVRGGGADANRLIGAYTRPFLAGFGAGAASGWFNTAATHKPGRFSFTVFGTGSIVPSEDQTFNPQTLGLQNFQVNGNSSPTIMGSSNTGPTVQVTNPVNGTPQNVPGGNFSLPGGFGVPIAPAAGAQLSIGVYKNTDVMIRYLPTINFGDGFGEFGLWGFGIKHDWKQWIPGLAKAPFHSAIIFGYQRIDGQGKLELTKQGGVADPSPRPIDNQLAEFRSSAWMLGVVASKTFTVFTLYGGILFQRSTNELALTGTYPITSLNSTTGMPSIAYLDNPVLVSANNPNSIAVPIGFRLKFGLFTFNLDYTLAKYMQFSTGLGVSFGENGSMDDAD